MCPAATTIGRRLRWEQYNDPEQNENNFSGENRWKFKEKLPLLAVLALH
jgi:hypothetical protein